MPDSETDVRERIEVKGIVQGVGFRPFVFSLARRLGLNGFVRNHSAGVSIEVQGKRERLTHLVTCLRTESPRLAHIVSVEVCEIPPVACHDFQILHSESKDAASTPLSPDVAACEDCLTELNDATNRRFHYPFTNCTNCGPRYTIIRDIPYDRALTTMSGFQMCETCQREYHDPADRRYHAQPNACPLCGPTVWFISSMETIDAITLTHPSGFAGEDAIAAFHRSIEADQIVATKGIGGFHLACSATSTEAIRKLRERKGRIDKPLAIMVSDIASARRVASMNDEEASLLESRARPIVLLRRRDDSGLSELIAPGNDLIGIMLPYSPLHALLVERQAVVMTSGNASEEPIVRTNREAGERLSSLADAFLLHNREIHVVCDDSVVRVLRGQELPIRRSRGYAPMPVRWNRNGPSVLAVGGELKATFCLTRGRYAYLSPHIGDMENLKTLEAFRRTVDHFQRLFRSEPEIVACDLHPGYHSAQWAREYARTKGLKLVEVQHHHAHIASVLAEQDIDHDQSVIGISFDGTGYGPDGAIWGGEILIASCDDYKRWAHLKYVPLPGADACVRHPYRSALAHLWAAGLPWDDRLPCVAHCSALERKVLRRQLDRNLNCARTSSMGRLFDAVAALIGIRQSVSYEAQAAIEMEAMSVDRLDSTSYPFTISGNSPCIIDPGPLFEAIISDLIANVPRGTIINRFHCSISQIIVDCCLQARLEEHIHQVALSGGVFQNQLLLQQTIERLEEAGFEVFFNRIVPANDGGLALGQAIIATASIASDRGNNS